VNHRIRATKVRLIDLEGGQKGVVDVRDALQQAQDLGYDLVEVSPNSNPPVCRIMDFGKYLYALKRKDREARKHQKNIDIKEVKFSVKISDHDFQTKAVHCKEFLAKGNKVKATMFLRGREVTRAEYGMRIFKRLIVDLEEYGTGEKAPALEGNIISLMFAPKSGKNSPSKVRKEEQQHGQETQAQDEQSGQKTL